MALCAAARPGCRAVGLAAHGCWRLHVRHTSPAPMSPMRWGGAAAAAPSPPDPHPVSVAMRLGGLAEGACFGLEIDCIDSSRSCLELRHFP
eukprot:5295720-Prymnesium_polylepis.1